MAEKGLSFLLKAPATGITATFDDTTDLATMTSHGMSDGDPVAFTTTGTLPALASGTFEPSKAYYVGTALTSTFSVHPTKADGIAGTNGLDFTDTGSGTHTGRPLITVAGLRTNSFTINGEAVDVTTKDSTSQWRVLLAGAGTVGMSLSGSGIFQDNSNLADMRAAAITRVVEPHSIVFQSGDEYSGLFQVTSVEQAGEFNDGVTYNVSLESAGEIFFVSN